MALIGQILSVSYPAVLAEVRMPQNQWAESAFLREMERQGGVDRKSLGATIDAPLDYRRNPNAVFLTTDLQPLSLGKTEVITSAVYDIGEIAAPITWSNKDEVQNPSENQKVALVKSLIKNGIDTHDDLIEDAFFDTSTNGFLGFGTHIPTSGQGSDGGIDSATETWWRVHANTYVDDTDIEAAMTTTWNQCAKGSGSKLVPTMMTSDAATQALFESTQQALQRYVDEQELKAGFKVIGFKTGRYVFSQYAGTSIYFLNPKSYRLVVSREFYRDLSETIPIPNAAGWTKRVYSALQTVTDNRSRLGVCYVA